MELPQGAGMRTQKRASKQERLLVQSIAAAAATMEAPARPTSQEPGKAPGKPATQKPTVRIPDLAITSRLLLGSAFSHQELKHRGIVEVFARPFIVC